MRMEQALRTIFKFVLVQLFLEVRVKLAPQAVQPFTQFKSNLQLQIIQMNFGFPSTNYAQSQVSSSTTQYDSNHSGVENGGLFSKEECRNLARKIIETYDGNNDGICETIEVAKWLVDCYRAMNKSFQPTATDIASYVHVIDRNRNGKVTVEELQNFIIRYFFNPNRG